LPPFGGKLPLKILSRHLNNFVKRKRSSESAELRKMKIAELFKNLADFRKKASFLLS
jgi:hypothetical protein